jgi:hypothetical protein
MTKHTPGPWYWETDDSWPYVCGPAHQRIADIYPQGFAGTTKSAMANTHLIVAAPDMLAALIAIKAETVEGERINTLAREAIAKAAKIEG